MRARARACVSELYRVRISGGNPTASATTAAYRGEQPHHLPNRQSARRPSVGDSDKDKSHGRAVISKRTHRLTTNPASFAYLRGHRSTDIHQRDECSLEASTNGLGQASRMYHCFSVFRQLEAKVGGNNRIAIVDRRASEWFDQNARNVRAFSP